MTEEILKIGMISGITCKDGRHYEELVCVDANNNEVRVVVPTQKACGRDDCDKCLYNDQCELQDIYIIDIGRSMIIKRM